MNVTPPNVYQFDDFLLDTESLALYYRGTMINTGGKKMLQVLTVFLRNPNRLVAHSHVLDEVWGNDHFGVTSDNINQYVRQIRSVLAQFESGREFFENKKGRGYIFTCEVTSVDESIAPSRKESKTSESRPAVKKSHSFSNSAIASAATLVLALLFGLWMLYPKNDIEAVKNVVKESQLYESLVLYKSPEQFKESDLDKYWSAELDLNGNHDREKIQQSIRKLVNEGRKYGAETKCEQFDFDSVTVNTTNDQATVRTLEKWLVAQYSGDGNLIKIAPVGPYFVDYVLRKIEGRWLIEKSNTARTIRPTPRLDELTMLTVPEPGKEFLVNLAGGDLEPVTIYLEVIGKGCPEFKPCKVDNGALLKRSKLSASGLERVPLTLGSGEFRILARNGDSKPSNQLTILVP